jgi:glycosyltransferase involved in cell wall biosynthesis
MIKKILKNDNKRVTFVLPQGSGFSGGVRVTVEMANKLLIQGYKVRIAFHRISILSFDYYKKMIKTILVAIKLIINRQKNNWLHEFKGKIVHFTDLNNLQFTDGEVVIAVGLMTVKFVANLKMNVYKIRYCHGLQEQNNELMLQAWEPDMATITVTEKLVSKIKELTKNENIKVIPNGIDLQQYFVEDYERNGIGTIYNNYYIKNPEFVINLMNVLKKEFSQVPQYLFGINKKPKELAHCNYYRYPLIKKAREFYNRSKIWLIASRNEGFSLPILEAMACGCAVISTEHAGALELIKHGINGYIVPVDNINEFLKYIYLLLHNETLRLSIVKNSLETVKSFNWDFSVNKMIQYLDQISINHTPDQINS